MDVRLPDNSGAGPLLLRRALSALLLGALGGLAAFGLVGLFVGPVLLGIASAVWREWATEEN